jgi:hypothetical protein
MLFRTHTAGYFGTNSELLTLVYVYYPDCTDEGKHSSLQCITANL